MKFTQVPIEFINGIKINSSLLQGDYDIPIATFETTLFKSIKRGALISRNTDGIFVAVTQKIMTRSILLKFYDLKSCLTAKQIIENDMKVISEITAKTSDYCKFHDMHIEILGSLMFLRLSFFTDEASGHNMTTKASTEIAQYLKHKFICDFLSVSANFCVDKKNSSINGLLLRGIKGDAEIVISSKICEKILRTTPEKIEEIVYYKNYIGSNLAGSIRSANAHFANIIAGFYIATGQDVANIIEGSQGFSFAQVIDGNLVFSVSIPNIILGSIGHGKDLFFIRDNINKMNLGFDNLSQKLAIVLTAGVLCAELSLISALVNEEELIKSHIKYERRN